MSTNNRFNNIGSGGTDLTSGTAAIYVQSLKIAGLNPLESMATDGENNVISSTNFSAPTDVEIIANNGSGVVNIQATVLKLNGTQIDPIPAFTPQTMIGTDGTGQLISTDNIFSPTDMNIISNGGTGVVNIKASDLQLNGTSLAPVSNPVSSAFSSIMTKGQVLIGDGGDTNNVCSTTPALTVGGGNFVSTQTISYNNQYFLPTAAPVLNAVNNLQSDGSGNLSWVEASSGVTQGFRSATCQYVGAGGGSADVLVSALVTGRMVVMTFAQTTITGFTGNLTVTLPWTDINPYCPDSNGIYCNLLTNNGFCLLSNNSNVLFFGTPTNPIYGFSISYITV